MKTFLYALICLFFFSCSQNQQKEATTVVVDSAAVPTEPDTAVSTPASVEQIKQRYANINTRLQDGLLDSVSTNMIATENEVAPSPTFLTMANWWSSSIAIVNTVISKLKISTS